MGAEFVPHMDSQGWRLVITGHSLGAGAATLLTLKLRDRFKGAHLLHGNRGLLWCYGGPC